MKLIDSNGSYIKIGDAVEIIGERNDIRDCGTVIGFFSDARDSGGEIEVYLVIDMMFPIMAQPGLLVSKVLAAASNVEVVG